jgi:hypothetical protein
MIDGRLRTKTDSSTDRYVDCEMEGKAGDDGTNLSVRLMSMCHIQRLRTSDLALSGSI